MISELFFQHYPFRGDRASITPRKIGSGVCDKTLRYKYDKTDVLCQVYIRHIYEIKLSTEYTVEWCIHSRLERKMNASYKAIPCFLPKFELIIVPEEEPFVWHKCTILAYLLVLKHFNELLIQLFLIFLTSFVAIKNKN